MFDFSKVSEQRDSRVESLSSLKAEQAKLPVLGSPKVNLYDRFKGHPVKEHRRMKSASTQKNRMRFQDQESRKTASPSKRVNYGVYDVFA